MSRDNFSYSHGDTGSKPGSALDFQSNGRPDAQQFDWWWYTVIASINGHADEFTRLDSDDDGTVDEADYALDADKVDGEHASAFANAGHIHDNRYYTESELNTETDFIDENGKVLSGDFSWISPINLADTETVEVVHATLLDETAVAVADGVDLILGTKSANKATILAGDGTSFYDDETPGTTYQNTTGSPETLLIGVDNGQFNVGSGSDQTINATATYKTY